jgi:hypothetical protein
MVVVILHFLMLGGFAVAFGFTAYRAWFKPHEYRREVEQDLWRSGRWNPRTSQWQQSDIYLWLARIWLVLFFVVCAFGSISVMLQDLRLLQDGVIQIR